jgi:hypothetical protein
MRFFRKETQSGDIHPTEPPTPQSENPPVDDTSRGTEVPGMSIPSREIDNRALRIRRMPRAEAFWREIETRATPVPYLRTLFSSEREGLEALESLPFVGTAGDTGNIVCDEPITLIYCWRPGGEFEVSLCGEGLTPDRWQQARQHLTSRGGSLKNECRPERQTMRSGGVPKVRMLREYVQVGLRGSRRVQVYRAESAAAARIFLRERSRFDVRGAVDILIETPEGVLGPGVRDAQPDAVHRSDEM